MKKYFLVASLIAAAGLCTAEAQTRTFTAADNARRSDRIQRQQAPVPRRGGTGALPRVARAGGNPLHLINPRAPRRYFGPPEDTVTHEPYFNRERYSGQQITGLILVGVTW